MLSVPHRSASGSLDHGWEYDAREHAILCNVRAGTLSVAIRAEVCGRPRLVFGTHPIARLSEEVWCILPERVIRTWPNRIERLDTIRCPVREELGTVAIALTNTPAEVSALLEGL